MGVPRGSVGEESRRIIVKAKEEADDILAKARAILEEARSVQASFDLSYQDQRAEARRIGFDEGFRVGRARGEEQGRGGKKKATPPRGRSKAVEMLEEAAGRLREALERFEADRKRYLTDLRTMVRRMSVGVDGEPRQLPRGLTRFLKEEPPKAELRPEDEIWLEKTAKGDSDLEPSVAHSGVGNRRRRKARRPAASSTRGRGRRGGGSAPR